MMNTLQGMVSAYSAFLFPYPKLQACLPRPQLTNRTMSLQIYSRNHHRIVAVDYRFLMIVMWNQAADALLAGVVCSNNFAVSQMHSLSYVEGRHRFCCKKEPQRVFGAT